MSPSNVMDFTPEAFQLVTPEALRVALHTSKRSSAPGLPGMCEEHLQVLLQDEGGLELRICGLLGASGSSCRSCRGPCLPDSPGCPRQCEWGYAAVATRVAGVRWHTLWLPGFALSWSCGQAQRSCL